jgi:hypothetical protein
MGGTTVGRPLTSLARSAVTGLHSAGGSNRHRFLRLIGLGFFNGVLLIIILSFTLWAAGALYFMFPINALRPAAAAIYTFAVLVLLVAIRPLWKGAIAALGLFLLVLAWYFTIYPSNEGHWQPDVAETAWAKIDGNTVTIHNFRNFDYQSSTDFVPNWETKTVDLTQLRAVDLFINGYADQMLYERGDLVGQVTFADLKKQALINEKAKATDRDPQFSQRIRAGVIGF